MSKLENQTFQPIEVIRVDGERATWVTDDPEGLHCLPNDFVAGTGISLEQLMEYARTGEKFIINENEPPYTAGFMIEREEKASSYLVYEFTNEDGSLRFFVDTSGDGKSNTPESFTEWCGLPFSVVEEHARIGELLEIPNARPCFVRSFEVNSERNPRDEVMADLYNNIVRFRRLDEDDRDHVLSALEHHLGDFTLSTPAA